MTNEIRKVNLVGIINAGIKEDPGYYGYAFLPLKLSSIPDPRWIEIFEHEYEICAHNKKRDIAEKKRDEMLLHIGEEDDLQILYDIVKEVIETTNKEVDRRNVGILAQEEAQDQESQRRKEKIDRLKEKADKVNL